MKREVFDKLISSVKETNKTLDALSAFHFELMELKMMDEIWGVQDALLSSILNETQLDYLNWWIYENHLGIGGYDYNKSDLYTGTDEDMVYETMMGL